MYVISKNNKSIKNLNTKKQVKTYLKSQKSTKGISVYEKVKLTQPNLNKARKMVGVKTFGKNLMFPVKKTYAKKYW